MAIYTMPPPHERLNVFFGEFFNEMRKAPPQAYGAFLTRAEEEFKRLGYREENPAGVKNILIVRLDAIGDMILTSGFIREVRANFPRARITLVVSPLTFPLVELCPYVNEVLIFNIKSLDRTFAIMLEQIAVFCKDNLWQKNFLIAFSPQWSGNNLPSLILMWLSGAKERVGYGTDSHNVYMGNPVANMEALDNFFLTKNVIIPRNIILEVERHLYLLTGLGFKVNQTHMELFYGAEDFKRARELLQSIPVSCKKVILGIGAGGDNRKYPAKKYLVALRELVKKDLFFVIVGGQNELDDADFLEKNLPRGKVLNFVGKTTLRETAAIISQADFYVGNDTGVLHMSAAAKLPVLCICREAVDRENILTGILSILRRFYPYQTKSIILRPEHPLGECAILPPVYGHCHHVEPHCITQITPQEIIDGFEKLTTL